MNKEFTQSFERLKAFCEQEAFKGYDPFDGLNSRLFQSLPWLPSSRWMRLAWLQFFKRFPFNLRPLVGVPKEYNPKALGLFLSGYCRLYQLEGKQEYLDRIRWMIDQIRELKSAGWSGSCWGYNFDWQARAFFQPRNTPTVVASSFIAHALLDAYEILGYPYLLEEARSTCDFILRDLNRTSLENGDFAFSYSPLDKSVVYNASLLGSRLLARVFRHTGESHLKEEALRSVSFCCSFQRADGAWAYGQAAFHQWVDNFHTGYNLECLQDTMRDTGDFSWQSCLDKGYEYYIWNFFTVEGIPKYYDRKTYPVDIHATAQLIITLDKLGRLQQEKELADRVLQWTVRHMQARKGYFYYQMNKLISSRIPYMRWAQAWMFYAFSIYLKSEKDEKSRNLQYSGGLAHHAGNPG